MDNAFLRTLACPHDHTALRPKDGALECELAHSFAFEQGVPVFTAQPRREPVPLNMPPMPPVLPVQRQKPSAQTPAIDAFVNDWIVNTNGNLYWRARGRLTRYPIPQWPFGAGNGKTLLDIGCSWGRWSIAAARAGFQPIGLDVHIDALAAAGRVSQQLGADCHFACTGVEKLPIASRSIDCVFSYSVLQHIDKTKVRCAFREFARVLKPGGVCMIQLPNAIGPLSLAQQLRRGFREARPGSFEMRYWSRAEMRRAFKDAGLAGIRIRSDGFFSQNPQLADLDLLSLPGKLLVLVSYAGRKAADALPILARLADSLWIEARAPGMKA
ncbi:MAG TPA: methyltransferase domain-containing protein [Candidatus Acidoferrales bacterium]|nr:methyltransferase domain-containing protein [Candidatus Acidoferrales bacterium]